MSDLRHSVADVRGLRVDSVMTSIARPWIGAAIFAALWTAAAVVSPTTTLHLAPAITAGWPAATSERTDLLGLGAIGLSIAAVAAIVLSVAGHLQGPSLLPVGGPLAEAMVAAPLGAAIGVIIGRYRGATPARVGEPGG